MSYAHPEYLVDTAWLEKNLGDPALRVFDCTVHLVPDEQTVYRIESGRPGWEAAHVPGSGYIDLHGDLSDRASDLRFTMPPAEQFAAAMSRDGIGPGTRAILYSAGMNMWATRIWWMLRAFGFTDAAVLDGGWEKWQAEGRPVSTDACTYPPAQFSAQPQPGWIATRDDVRSAIDDGDVCVLNALSARQHSGTSGPHYGRPGRIASSVNVPAFDLVDRETGAFKPPEALRALLDEAGATDARQVITYCGGGIAATSTAFALVLLGHDDVAIYDGSLSEWVRDPSLPMETD
jgi:thiosulfate/3-mercaptopyruvate sulfurtransferase